MMQQSLGTATVCSQMQFLSRGKESMLYWIFNTRLLRHPMVLVWNVSTLDSVCSWLLQPSTWFNNPVVLQYSSLFIEVYFFVAF